MDFLVSYLRKGSAALAVTAALAAPAYAERISNPVAEFNGLDKITGRITSFDVYIGETVQFGALQVTPRVCYTRDEEESQRIDSFVEVEEITLDRKIRRIFTGWMFASSPGLNAVEHPIYDVWLKGCKATSDVPPPPGAKPAEPAPVPQDETQTPAAAADGTDTNGATDAQTPATAETEDGTKNSDSITLQDGTVLDEKGLDEYFKKRQEQGGQIQIDPQTGETLTIDPQTGEPITPNVDPQTGEPLQQIDPLTGQPLKVDPLTGDPLPDDGTQQQTDPNFGGSQQLQGAQPGAGLY